MAVVPLSIDTGSQARTILHHLLERGDVAGHDAVGRTIITLAVDDWLLERLMTFEAGAEDHEDNGDGEPDDGTRPAVDHRSFRDQFAFSIGFAVSQSRALLRRLLKEHAPDDARQMLAERVVEHLELSGFEIDEGEQVMRKRPPTRDHG
jgi:hypothetical protein